MVSAFGAVVQVTIVGQIMDVQQQQSHVLYKVDDGTGLCHVKYWTDADDELVSNIVEPKDLWVSVFCELTGKC